MSKTPYLPAFKTQSTLTSKGQITLPVELRRRWGLQPGDRLDFTLEADGRVVIRKWLRRSIFEIGELQSGEKPPETAQNGR